MEIELIKLILYAIAVITGVLIKHWLDKYLANKELSRVDASSQAWKALQVIDGQSLSVHAVWLANADEHDQEISTIRETQILLGRLSRGGLLIRERHPDSGVWYYRLSSQACWLLERRQKTLQADTENR